jgi:hypothetical protein
VGIEMDFATLYAEDVETWAELQVDALRRLAATPGSWANIIDWENVLEEIELVQAIAGYCDPDSLLRHERNRRVHSGQSEAERDLSPTIRARLDLDRLWREAFDQAMTEIPRRVLGVPPGIPRTCPFTLDELLADDFTYDRAVERLYILLTSWRPKAEKDNER